MRYSSHARIAGMIGALGAAASLFLWALQPSIGQLSDRVILACIFALPLLLAFIGLLRQRIRTAGWCAMLAVLYMSHALAEYVVNGGSPGMWLTLLFSSLLFAGCALYPRLRAREGTASRI